MGEHRYELVGAAHQAIAVAVLENTCADQAWVIHLSGEVIVRYPETPNSVLDKAFLNTLRQFWPESFSTSLTDTICKLAPARFKSSYITQGSAMN